MCTWTKAGIYNKDGCGFEMTSEDTSYTEASLEVF